MRAELPHGEFLRAKVVGHDIRFSRVSKVEGRQVEGVAFRPQDLEHLSRLVDAVHREIAIEKEPPEQQKSLSH
jgi:hypothetical protein